MGIFDKFKKGLEKARDSLFGGIKTLFAGRVLDEETLEELEEILIMSDMGIEVTDKILTELKARYKKDETSDPLLLLRDIMKENLTYDPLNLTPEKKPYVIMVVGVNGAGKTTSISKIAKKYIDNDKSVVMAAADTFRAAAIEQLQFWGEKVGATVIAHEQGSDAAAVAFDALSHAKAKGKDVVIVDTAGRLHNKSNLMKELSKIQKVILKEVGQIDEVIMVLDGTTGQNGIQQAKIFKEFVDLTGIIITKLDGTAKGGIAFSIDHELKLPIKLVCVGEKVDDLQEFNPEFYCNALLDLEE